MTSPNEPNHWTCQSGCHIHSEDEIYTCSAKGCPDELLCVGCIWQCGDCREDFCEQHIADASGALNVAWTVFLCAACLERRKEEFEKEAA